MGHRRRRRISAVESRLEAIVEERLEAELEAAVELLEANLSREEFTRVARILAKHGEEEEA